METTHLTTREVDEAARLIPDDLPYAEELRTLLNRAVAQALEDEDYWIEEGKPHLRTFLKITPVGLAIVELARAILDNTPKCPYTHSHTRNFCGYSTCREN